MPHSRAVLVSYVIVTYRGHVCTVGQGIARHGEVSEEFGRKRARGPGIQALVMEHSPHCSICLKRIFSERAVVHGQYSCWFKLFEIGSMSSVLDELHALENACQSIRTAMPTILNVAWKDCGMNVLRCERNGWHLCVTQTSNRRTF